MGRIGLFLNCFRILDFSNCSKRRKTVPRGKKQGNVPILDDAFMPLVFRLVGLFAPWEKTNKLNVTDKRGKRLCTVQATGVAIFHACKSAIWHSNYTRKTHENHAC